MGHRQTMVATIEILHAAVGVPAPERHIGAEQVVRTSSAVPVAAVERTP
jgi:hypothetical protein